MKSNIYELLGERSINGLSYETGISKQTIYSWQNHGSKIYLKLRRLADSLGCSIDDLFTLDESDRRQDV